MKRFGGWVLFVLLVLGVIPAPAQPLGADTHQARCRLVGGQLTLATNGADVVMGDVVLTGNDQLSSGSSTPTFTIIDATGSGNGWNLTVQSSDFSDGLNVIPAANFSYTASGGILTAVFGQTVDGAGGPRETGLSGPLNLTLKAVTTSVGFGRGNYTWSPGASSFSLLVPAETFAGTYTATMTFTLASGP
ncbi:MAG: WxL domain-containing protein [Armatimonadetes bacterium]|nr:WxL domain-containing protein [Armatimonadota bacterium]